MKLNLPQSPDSHDQERTSLFEFQRLVPQEQFIVRQELGGDYGVDLVLELRIDTKSVSNFRSHVQLKSVHSGERNRDSTFSFPVPITTLNYLMNQPNSLFAVYLENEDTFFWEWCRNIFYYSKSKELDITQTSQGTISYRFRNILNREAFGQIHQQIISNSEMIRHLTELTPLFVESKESPTILLQKTTIVDLDELSHQLKQFGYTFISSGEIQLINDALDHFPSKYKSDIDFALFVAYARFSYGNMLDALSWLPNKKARLQLSEEAKVFCEQVEIALHFSIGLIDSAGYAQGLQQIEERNSESPIILQIKLERLKRSLLSTTPSQTVEILTEMEMVAQKLIQYPNIHPSLKFEATCALWEVEGYKQTYHFVELDWERMLAESLPNSLLPKKLQEHLQQLLQAHNLWFKQFMELRQQALQNNNVVAVGKLLHTFAYVTIFSLALPRQTRGQQEQTPLPQLGFICQEIEKVFKVLLNIGDYPLALRLRLLEAEALEGDGQSEKAVVIAHEVQDMSDQVGFPEIEKNAHEFINGVRMFRGYGFFDSPNGSSQLPLDNFQESDEAIEFAARNVLKAFNLPENRLKWIKKNIKWQMEDEAEQRNFCKHIGTLQNLLHQRSYETFFQQDPPRIVICAKFGYRSTIESTHRDGLLKAFKGRFCVECSSKEIG